MLGRAAGDLRYLLGRGYPRGRSLALVGDRYALPAQERCLLGRGVLAPALAHAGPVASGDGALIDQVAQPLDLAGAIIQQIFPPERLVRLR